MTSNDAVIEAYVLEVMRRLPARSRGEIGLELRGLLTDMLAERAAAEGRPADDAMVLAALTQFGTPAEVAARYRSSDVIIIPADRTKAFAWLSIGGIALQWALTLPRVFDGEPLVAWWLTWGLGSLWWPGFLAMTALVAAWLRRDGSHALSWQPNEIDPERVNRNMLAVGLVCFAIGSTAMLAFPWIASRLPAPFAEIFAFDAGFLHERAWPVALLWLGSFSILAAVLAQGRWSPRLRRCEIIFDLAWVALLGWWLAAGKLFQAAATNEGARAAIALVILMILFDVAYKVYRGRLRIPAPETYEPAPPPDEPARSR